MLHPHEIVIRRLRNLQPGEILVYHIGFLEADRLNDPDGSINRVADAAYDLMCAGMLHLTQKRISAPITKDGFIDWKIGKGHGFRYLATGATVKPKRNPQFLSLSGVSS